MKELDNYRQTVRKQFYSEVAEALGKDELTNHEMNIAFSVRINATLSFEKKGSSPTLTPSHDQPIVMHAWNITQQRLSQTYRATRQEAS